jgi:hypothetical protein
VMAFGLVMGTSGQLGDGGAPASFGDKSCPLLSALRQCRFLACGVPSVAPEVVAADDVRCVSGRRPLGTGCLG